MVSKPVDPWRQIADWRRAISYLESLDAVDSRRIGVWGTSYAGGHAIILGATDRRLGCVVAQVPTISGYEAGPDVQSVGWSFCAPQPERSLGRAALS
jgi:cephalosporin-C deacetylase-like acetyl esterase